MRDLGQRRGKTTPENCVLLLDYQDFCPGELTLPVFFSHSKEKKHVKRM
jgi:hypothetical protein